MEIYSYTIKILAFLEYVNIRNCEFIILRQVLYSYFSDQSETV